MIIWLHNNGSNLALETCSTRARGYVPGSAPVASAFVPSSRAFQFHLSRFLCHWNWLITSVFYRRSNNVMLMIPWIFVNVLFSRSTLVFFMRFVYVASSCQCSSLLWNGEPDVILCLLTVQIIWASSSNFYYQVVLSITLDEIQASNTNLGTAIEGALAAATGDRARDTPSPRDLKHEGNSCPVSSSITDDISWWMAGGGRVAPGVLLARVNIEMQWSECCDTAEGKAAQGVSIVTLHYRLLYSFR